MSPNKSFGFSSRKWSKKTIQFGPQTNYSKTNHNTKNNSSRSNRFFSSSSQALDPISLYSSSFSNKKWWIIGGLIGSSLWYLFQQKEEKKIAYAKEPDTNAQINNIIAQAEKYFDQGKTIEVYEFLQAANTKYPNEVQILWRLARASHEKSLLPSTSAEEKKKLSFEGHQFAKRALEVNPNSFAAHKWFGITLNDVGEYEGTKALLSYSYIIRDHFLKAIELNPKDATSHHLMGLWCFSFADLAWYKRTIASALFATPPSSTYEDALRFFLNAEEADPGFYKKNSLMVAKCFLKLGNKEEAKKWLDIALKMKVANEDDKSAHEETEKLLKELK